MSKITKVVIKDEERVWVYVDNHYCCSIRQRTWKAMNLGEGSEITCEALKDKENFFWKKAYGETAWKKEKVRIDRIVGWFKKYIPEVAVNIVGFGAESNEFIDKHPENHGEPDLSICIPNTDIEIIALEVTGTEEQRGNGYWIRPDKISYIQNNPSRDIWIALHYQKPNEKFIWLKPELKKQYNYINVEIRGATEHYISFDEHAVEIKSSETLRNYIRTKIKSLT
jgi:hypothetical protein